MTIVSIIQNDKKLTITWKKPRENRDDIKLLVLVYSHDTEKFSVTMPKHYIPNRRAFDDIAKAYDGLEKAQADLMQHGKAEIISNGKRVLVTLGQ